MADLDRDGSWPTTRSASLLTYHTQSQNTRMHQVSNVLRGVAVVYTCTIIWPYQAIGRKKAKKRPSDSH
jgi:hypothetical protein